MSTNKPVYYYSADLLVKRGACKEWVKRFRQAFGNGEVPLTLEFCEKLLRCYFPVDALNCGRSITGDGNE